MKQSKTMINSGFTLIELLVVISIIGVLATLLLANVTGVRERGRDAQRKSDVSQLQKALEMYKNSQVTPFYPAGAFGALITALESGNFMRSVPHDPKCGWDGSACTTSWPDYSYQRDPDAAGDNLTYKLIACTENASDPQNDLAKASYCSSARGSFSRREP